MATVDSAFRYWFDRFVIDSGVFRTDANSAIARAAFSAGRKAQASDYATLQARLAACEADARRYRWLRSRSWRGSGAYFFTGPKDSGGSLDAAIDSAISAGGE